jgi:hypothetical protein
MLLRVSTSALAKYSWRFISTHAMQSTTFSPPVHRGLKELDRSLFFHELKMIALKMPVTETGKFIKGYGKECVLSSVYLTGINQ